MQIYYDKDADLSIIRGKKVGIIGFGSQGHAHAGNLKDSGVDVVVALRPNSPTAKKAEAAGLAVKSVPEAVKWADLVMVLTPDEFQSQLYKNEIEYEGGCRGCNEGKSLPERRCRGRYKGDSSWT